MSNRSKTAGLPGGGWSLTAYSNNETFARASAVSFANYAANIGMHIKGVYPGNATNDMIYRWNDANFVESGHLAYINSHGSTYGPDVEYVPSALSYSAFEWGDRGLTQWVFIQGCDCLGFPIFPDGRPAPFYPNPQRWAESFMGISGMIGYRSASWYIPGIASEISQHSSDYAVRGGLPESVSAAFFSSLVAGATYYDAWRVAADHLHRNLGRQAQVAVFPSNVNALADRLGSFYPRRQPGIDWSGIRYHGVGNGSPPEFHYCDRVDQNGNYACFSIEPTRTTDIDGVKFVERPSFLERCNEEKQTVLPVFSYRVNESNFDRTAKVFRHMGIGFDPHEILAADGDYQPVVFRRPSISVAGDTIFIFRPDTSVSTFLEELTECSHEKTDGLVSAPDFQGPMAQALQLGGQRYGLIGRHGGSITDLEIGPVGALSVPIDATLLSDTRVVPSVEEAVDTLARRLPNQTEEVELIDTGVCYLRLGGRLFGKLVPCRRVDIHRSNGQSRSSCVYLF